MRGRLIEESIMKLIRSKSLRGTERMGSVLHICWYFTYAKCRSNLMHRKCRW